MTDSKALRNIVKCSGMTYKHIAEYIGITPYSLAKKIDNKSYFNAREIQMLCEVLEIKSLRMKDDIFFAG